MYVLIQPDVLKVEKCYWYEITDETKSSDSIIIGSIIKVIFNFRICEPGTIRKNGFTFEHFS